MKNFIYTTVMLFSIWCSSILNAQGELTPGVQTSTLTASISNWVSSTSDKNESFYASAYWVSGVDCGNYLKVYNGTTFASTSPQVLISSYHGFTRIRLDDANNVYVLYVDRTSPGSSVFRTYLKKYNTSGTQLGPRIEVANNTNVTDIEVAPNGDVLIGCVESNLAKVKVFRNMLYKGYLPINGITSITNTSPFSIQMDMKGNKFAVGYSFGSIASPQLHIKRFTYVPIFMPIGAPINLSNLHSHYTESGSRFEANNNQIALRTNWEVFFNVNTATSYPFNTHRVKYLNSGGSSIFQYSKGFVDVDISNRLLLSKDYGTAASGSFKVKLFSNSNSAIHEYILSDNIKNHLESIAIYDCEFVVTGIDRKFGANPLLHTYQSYHQLFNCQDCRPNMGATAVAKFRFPYQVHQYPSKYGPLDVTELCLVDDLLVDGALSSCETGYFVGLSEFDPATWTNTLVLHSDWVTPLTQAPNNINIVDFLPAGYHLRPGKIYKFRLAVGHPWHAVDLFFEVSCCKRKIVIAHEEDEKYEFKIIYNTSDSNSANAPINYTIYPNPTKKELTLDFSNFNAKHPKTIRITNAKGTQIFSNTITTDKTTITAEKWATGLYVSTVIIDGKTYRNKIIKE